MNLDLRKPVAVLFFVLGTVLAAFGLLSPGTHAEVSPGFNINLVWGSAMILFGGLLGLLSWWTRQRS